MKLAPVHLEYWHARNAPTWAAQCHKQDKHTRARLAMLRARLVHRCVNAHAGEDREAFPDAANLLGIVGMWRRAGDDILRNLDRIAISPGTVVNPKRRAGYARKWAMKIRKTTQNSQA